jgi:cytochrome c-type biogenesis protein CcmF
MAAEIGHFALILALLISLVQATWPFIGASRGDYGLMALASHCAVGCFVFVAFSFQPLPIVSLFQTFRGTCCLKPQLAKP